MIATRAASNSSSGDPVLVFASDESGQFVFGFTKIRFLEPYRFGMNRYMGARPRGGAAITSV